ncbi:MAG: FkbM family methyltransferase [Microvirga sp.]
MDIGANLGIYSLLARRHGFETMVFEPEPNHAQFLQRNKHIFTRVFPIALSDQKGVADFFVGREGKLASSSLVKASGSTLYDHTVPVDVDTFSNVIAENAIDPSRVRLMKVDVEGAEVSVIQGMIAFLESGHRPAIWCEVRGDSKGRSAGSYRTVWDLLKRYDYQAYDDNSLKPFDGDASRKTQVFDLLFQAAETK